MYLGSWKIDDLLTFPANTHTAATGAATDADSVPAYRVYEDETGTPILTGTMALLDSANTVGFYSEQITLSAANGFEKGKSYTVYIAATVASVVGTMSHSFQIEAEVDANTVSPIVTANATQLAGQTITAAAGVTFPTSVASPTNITAGTITTVTNLTNAPTAGDLTATMKTSVETAATAALTAFFTSAATLAAAVWAVATRTLTAGTNIVLTKGVGVTGFNDLSAADVRTAVGLASANLDTQLDALPTAIENADALLTRDVDNVEATAPVHSLTSIILKLVSRFNALTGRTYRTNGTTVHMTQTPTTNAAMTPIEQLDVGA